MEDKQIKKYGMETAKCIGKWEKKLVKAKRGVQIHAGIWWSHYETEAKMCEQIIVDLKRVGK